MLDLLVNPKIIVIFSLYSVKCIKIQPIKTAYAES